MIILDNDCLRVTFDTDNKLLSHEWLHVPQDIDAQTLKKLFGSVILALHLHKITEVSYYYVDTAGFQVVINNAMQIWIATEYHNIIGDLGLKKFAMKVNDNHIAGIAIEQSVDLVMFSQSHTTKYVRSKEEAMAWFSE